MRQQRLLKKKSSEIFLIRKDKSPPEADEAS